MKAPRPTRAEALETFLARLYTDDVLRRDFVSAPRSVARAAGLADDDVEHLAQIDLDGLALAADGFARKRAAYRGPPHAAGWLASWVGWRR